MVKPFCCIDIMFVATWTLQRKLITLKTPFNMPGGRRAVDV